MAEWNKHLRMECEGQAGQRSLDKVTTVLRKNRYKSSCKFISWSIGMTLILLSWKGAVTVKKIASWA